MSEKEEQLGHIELILESDKFVKFMYKLFKVLFGNAYKGQYLKKDVFVNVTTPPDPRHIGDTRSNTSEELAKMENRLPT